MTLATGNPEVKFRPRLLEGVSVGSPKEPGLLLLDGQQRLTSLFFALYSSHAVVTRDTRGNQIKRHYYADIKRCIDPFSSREDEGIVGIPQDRLVTTDFGRAVLKDLRTRDDEVMNEMFPLDIVFDPGETMDWQMDYLSSGPGEPDERLKNWKQFMGEVITPISQYQVPTIKLAQSTSKEAVCQVFEKVNTGGVSLTVFELLTATFAADDFNLRDDWDERSSTFRESPVLRRLEAPQFLQVVTLLTTYDRRMNNLDNPTPPAVSCKRRDVLRLALPDYKKWAEEASKGLQRAVEFLHGEHVFTARDLPYASQLVPLGAVFAILGKTAETLPALQKIRRWYWCGVFGEMYGGSTETRFAFDLPECVDWIKRAGDEPRTVKEAQFQAERLLTLRTRNSAAYKGLYALQMKGGCIEFKSGVTMEAHAFFDHGIDIHHVFPKKSKTVKAFPSRIVDSVVNKTPIGSHTNRLIGSKAPSKYLRLLEDKFKIESHNLDEILRSHDTDPATLREDDFPSFFNQRFERMLQRIAQVMGKPVNRNSNHDESPFSDLDTPEPTENVILDLIADGENDKVEYKSTGRMNLHTGNKDPVIEWSILKSVAGFLNTNGGTLLVGINDAGKPVGIEEDYAFVHGADRDGWELWLTDLISLNLGKTNATTVKVRYGLLEGRTVALIEVPRSPQPVFAIPTKAANPSRGHFRKGESAFFYVRTGNATRELVGDELLKYEKGHWPAPK